MKKKSKLIGGGIMGATILGYLGVIVTDLLETFCGDRKEIDDIDAMKKDIEKRYGVAVELAANDVDGASYDPSTETVVLTTEALSALHEIGHVETHQALKKMLPRGVGDLLYQASSHIGTAFSFMAGISGLVVSVYGREDTKKYGPVIALSGGALMISNEAIASFLAFKKLKDKTGSWSEALKDGGDMFYWLAGYLSIPLAFGITAAIVKKETEGDLE